MTCTATINNIPVITELVVLPCADVPSVHITIEAFERVVVDEVLSKSQMIIIFENVATADITLDQLDRAIGIQVR